MSQTSIPGSSGRLTRPGWLALAAAAVVAAGCLLWTSRGGSLQAQVGGPGGGGLLAVPAQIARDSYGLFLVDPDRGTICVYQYQATARKLQLLASRTYRFDVQLDDWNTQPPPREIQDLVSQQRRLEALPASAPAAP